MTEDPFSILIEEQTTPPTDTEDTPPTTSTTEELPSEVGAYIEFLKQNELIDIPEDIEEIGSAHDLEKVFSHTKEHRHKQAVSSIFEALPEDFKPLLQYALSGGTSIEEYVNVYAKRSYESMDLEDESSQRSVLRELYKQTSKFSDDKIERLINVLASDGDLRPHAEEALSELKEMRKQEQEEFIQRQQQQAEEEQRALAQRTQDLTSAIESTPLIHSARKTKVKSLFFDQVQINGETTTKFNSVIQSILSNPEHQAQLGDLLLDYDPSKGFSQDRLERRVKSKATQSFQELLAKTVEGKQKTTTQDEHFPWTAYMEH